MQMQAHKIIGGEKSWVIRHVVSASDTSETWYTNNVNYWRQSIHQQKGFRSIIVF